MASNLPITLSQQQKTDITNYINSITKDSVFELNDALALHWQNYTDPVRQRLGKLFYEEVQINVWTNIDVYSYQNNHAKYIKL